MEPVEPVLKDIYQSNTYRKDLTMSQWFHRSSNWRTNSKFTGSFSWGCFMWHRLLWFLWCCFWSPYFLSCLFCVRPVAKLSLFVSVAEADHSLLSPLLPLSLILGNSLPCVTDGCWFSFISHILPCSLRG